MGCRGRHHDKTSDGGGYWRWLKPRPGNEGRGWIAGDIHIYPAHMGRPSVVCEEKLTRGRIKCPMCEHGMAVRDLGYLPVYADNGMPCVLIVHEYSFDIIGKIPFRAPVSWARGDEDEADPVTVTPRLSGGKYESTVPSRLVPQDITIAIARYWKRPDLLPDLVRWFRDPSPAGDDKPPAELVAIRDQQAAKQPSRGGTSSRKGVEAVTGEPLQPLLTDAMRAMLARNKQAVGSGERNGKPH